MPHLQRVASTGSFADWAGLGKTEIGSTFCVADILRVDGGEAMEAYAGLAGLPEAERPAVLERLLRYCGLD